MPSSATAPRDPVKTRQRLLDAAIKLFAESGFNGVSVDQIVDSVNVNKRMVYHYFGSKDKLYQEVLESIYQRIEQIEFRAIDRGRDPQEKLSRLLESYFDLINNEPEFTRLLLWENLQKGRHLAKGNAALTKNRFLKKFGAIIQDGIERGDFREDLNIPHLLIHFTGLCFIYQSNRFSLSNSLGVDLADPDVQEAGLRQVLVLVFEGIKKQPQPSVADLPTGNGSA